VIFICTLEDSLLTVGLQTLSEQPACYRRSAQHSRDPLWNAASDGSYRVIMTQFPQLPPAKPVSATRISLSRVMTQLDVNLLGNVHGGVIMKLVDDAAGLVASRHSGGPAVTAFLDEMAFLEPVHVGDLVLAHAQVNWTGNTSMEIGVRVEAERWDETGVQAIHVASAYLVFVAIDTDGKPRRTHPLVLETLEDERRNHEAGIRRSHRLARRAAILDSRGSS
jgi:acyl-CoA hydrolase